MAARTPKKVLQMAGIDDVYTAATGSTKTLGNFVKVQRQPACVHGAPVCILGVVLQTCLVISHC